MLCCIYSIHCRSTRTYGLPRQHISRHMNAQDSSHTPLTGLRCNSHTPLCLSTPSALSPRSHSVNFSVFLPPTLSLLHRTRPHTVITSIVGAPERRRHVYIQQHLQQRDALQWEVASDHRRPQNALAAGTATMALTLAFGVRRAIDARRAILLRQRARLPVHLRVDPVRRLGL